MIDNKKLLGNDNDIFQIKEVLEKSLDNKWTQEFVYLLRKFFYIEYWSNVEKNERYTIQMIQESLKKHLDFLDEDRRTEEVLRKFRAMLPYLQQLVISDMKAAYEGDPAAKSYEEIIAAYPGPLAVLIQRTANCLYKLKVPILPRIMTEYAHSITGIDIHPGAEIGESFFIDHGTGVVIGETAVIGNHVKIYQGVTLGALSTRGGHKQKWLKRHPTVEDNVTIYAGATILGGNTVIGQGTVVGGNAWVTKSIPKFAKVYPNMMEIKTKKNILAVSINANGENSHISYRLYNNLQEIVLDSNIIKSNIKLHDVLDALDTVVLQNEMIDVISIALPGVMVEGNVYSGIIEGGNHQLKELLEKRYEKEIYLINDVNAAVVGYYASQNQYKSIAFLFQPIGRMAGSGIIVNGQLVRGMDHLAGEVALLPLKLSNDYFTLANTPEGTLELVSKNIMSIIAIVSPEAIVVYSDLILDSQDVSDEIKKSLSQYSLKVYPKIIKVENILEYILLGAMILSAKE